MGKIAPTRVDDLSRHGVIPGRGDLWAGFPDPPCRVLLARDLKLLDVNDYETLAQLTTEIKRMLTVLVQKLTAES